MWLKHSTNPTYLENARWPRQQQVPRWERRWDKLLYSFPSLLSFIDNPSSTADVASSLAPLADAVTITIQPPSDVLFVRLNCKQMQWMDDSVGFLHVLSCSPYNQNSFVGCNSVTLSGSVGGWMGLLTGMAVRNNQQIQIRNTFSGSREKKFYDQVSHVFPFLSPPSDSDKFINKCSSL